MNKIEITTHIPYRIWPLLSEEEQDSFRGKNRVLHREVKRLAKLVERERRIVRGKMRGQVLVYKVFGSDNEDRLAGEIMVHALFPGSVYDKGTSSEWTMDGCEYAMTARAAIGWRKIMFGSALLVSFRGVEAEFSGNVPGNMLGEVLDEFAKRSRSRWLESVVYEVAECSLISK